MVLIFSQKFCKLVPLVKLQGLLVYSILRNIAQIQGFYSIWVNPHFGPLES